MPVGFVGEDASRREWENGVFVPPAAHFVRREDAVSDDPLACLFVRFARVRLKHEPFAGAPAPCIDLVTEARRELLFIEVGVTLRSQIDVALRQPKRAKILTNILGI